jgi:hypothetical protein
MRAPERLVTALALIGGMVSARVRYPLSTHNHTPLYLTAMTSLVAGSTSRSSNSWFCTIEGGYGGERVRVENIGHGIKGWTRPPPRSTPRPCTTRTRTRTCTRTTSAPAHPSARAPSSRTPCNHLSDGPVVNARKQFVVELQCLVVPPAWVARGRVEDTPPVVAREVVRPSWARVFEARAGNLQADGRHIMDHVCPVGGADAPMEACEHELVLGILQYHVREGHVLRVEVLPPSLRRVARGCERRVVAHGGGGGGGRHAPAFKSPAT